MKPYYREQIEKKDWSPISLDGQGRPLFPERVHLPCGVELMPLKEVSLTVSRVDFAEAVWFFESALGVQVIRDASLSALIVFRKGETRMRVIGDPGLPDYDSRIVGLPNMRGLRHLAFWVDGDLRAFAEQLSKSLKGHGYLPENQSLIEVFSNQNKQIAYFHGPGGVLLELMQYTDSVDSLSSLDLPRDPASERVKSSPFGPSIECIDHVNIVTADLNATLRIFIQCLGFSVVPGRFGRLSGPWIDNVTRLKGVDAYYVALEVPGGRTKLELIEYRHPASPMRLETTDTGRSAGLSALAFATNDPKGLAEHVQRYSGAAASVVHNPSGLNFMLRTNDGVEIVINEKGAD